MKNTFKFLKLYSSDTILINRLIISSFLSVNKIKVFKNKLILKNLIHKSENEYEALNEFTTTLKSEILEFNFEKLIELFEFVISPSDRIINGAIYTPEKIRTFIVSETFQQINLDDNMIRISDIAMGCGGFLYNASVELKLNTGKTFTEIFENNIFGLDIQEYSVVRAKLLLSLVALYHGEDSQDINFKLYQGDSLDFDWNTRIENFNGFNAVLGNPPYVSTRNLDSQTQKKLKNWEVCRSGNSDLYIPFFQISLENLSQNGVVGFITMNSFFKSLNGRLLRAYFQEKEFTLDIIDFGSDQVFKSRSTYTCICFIKKEPRPFIRYTQSRYFDLHKKQRFANIHYLNMNSRKGWNLKDNTLISKIESIGTPFGNLYQTRHGIATLRNDVYIFKPIREDGKYFYIQNGDVYRIEKSICRDILNSNRLSRPIALQDLQEKVIFPYDHQNRPTLLDENFFKDNFPEAYNYLNEKRHLLDNRDKGMGKYESWFAFGRTQSLEKVKNKLFFPKYSDGSPNFISSCDPNLLFYNGLAVINCPEDEMEVIKKIMTSKIFWYYIKTTSKPYSSNYFSLNGNYIRNFGVCNLSESEKKYLLTETNGNRLDAFFQDKYQIVIT